MATSRSFALLVVALLVTGCETFTPTPTPSPASAAGVIAPTCDLSVGPREVVVSAARRRELGLDYWPDLSLAVERRGDVYTFYADNGDPRGNTKIIARTSGTLEDPVQAVIPRIGVENPKVDYAYNGIASVYRDPKSNALLGFSYTERHFATSAFEFHSGTGIIKSTDDGKTWTDLGPIIDEPQAYDPASPRLGGRSGIPFIVGDYFHLYFMGMGVARAKVEDVVRAAVDRDALVPWMNYFNGAWNEPALGGRFTPLEMTGSPWTAYRSGLQGTPDLVQPYGGSYNSYLKKYVMVIGQWPMTLLGDDSADLHLVESSDGLLWENEREIEHGGWGSLYGTVVGTGSDPAASGSSFYVYYHYEPSNGGWADAVLARRLVSCLPSGRTGTALTIDARADPVKVAQNATISLKGTGGEPVPGAAIEASWVPTSGSGTKQDYALSGVVPAGAHSALVQVHYNQRMTGPVTGPVDVTLYDARYGESGGAPRTIPNGDFARGITGWGGTAQSNVAVATDATGQRGLNVKATPSQSGFLNSTTFPVTAGATYAFQVSARVAAESVNVGGFSIIFSDGHDDPRWTIIFSATRSVRGVTDATGTFAITDLPSSGFDVRARYEGDAMHRPAAPAFKRD